MCICIYIIYICAYIHIYRYLFICCVCIYREREREIYIYTYIGVCRCVNLRNGKSDSVRLRCDANALRMRCDAKLCVRVKRRDFRSWGFKWAMAAPWRGVAWRGVTPLVAWRNSVLAKTKCSYAFLMISPSILEKTI